MRLTPTVIAVLLVSAAAPSVAAELADSVFQVTFKYAGADEVLHDTVVPLLPGNACYNWYVKLADGAAPKAATETLSLPVALADWGTLATDPDDGIDISADGKVAARSFSPELDDEGRFSHSWCVAEGDGVGAHSIAIAVDGSQLVSYDFEVVLPRTITGRPHPARNAQRSVDDSW